MAVAFGDSLVGSFSQPCNCFRVASLKETILGTGQNSYLKDRYVLGEQLGWGQFGVIRACTDKLSGEVLACKSIAKERLVTQEDVRSVKLEIEIMTQLSGHPNVVDLKAVYEEEDYVHLVMELCAGGELFHQLEMHGRYPEAEARVLFRHLMLVVMYCHDNGVVHRDLKPENILLATKASSSPIKLADFGLATYIEPGQSLHGRVGSPFYIAPEVLGGGYTQAADVWSAGVILYILLSGMPPFWGKTKSKIFDAVRAADLRFPAEPWDCISESAKELIRKMLCTDPLKRLTAQQVLDHSWMEEQSPVSEDSSHGCRTSVRDQLNARNSSFSLMSRNDDISFGTGVRIICEPESPTFNCRSSFSSFLVEPSAPKQCLALGGFSFCASPIPSMPSFSFYSSGSMAEKGNRTPSFSPDVTSLINFDTETSSGKLIQSPNSILCLGHETMDSKHKATDAKRTGGIGSRMLGFHNKRNRTIGLGEFNQIDLIVSESVIRWASCTHLPTASSLRSSLVC